MEVTLASINKVFRFGEEENKVRVFGTSEEPWFYGKDVTGLLGYTNTGKAIRTHVKEKHKVSYGVLTEKFRPSISGGLTYNQKR